MKKVVKGLLLLLLIGFVFSACNNHKKEDVNQQAEGIEEKHTQDHDKSDHDHGYEVAMSAYQCPMKCEGDKTYNEQGACPTCKMDLKEIEAASNDAPSSEESDK